MQFSTYPTIYNLMSYNQEYNEQPIYELDLQYSDKTTRFSQTCIEATYRPEQGVILGAHTGFSIVGGIRVYSSQKGRFGPVAPTSNRCAFLAPNWSTQTGWHLGGVLTKNVISLSSLTSHSLLFLHLR